MFWKCGQERVSEGNSLTWDSVTQRQANEIVRWFDDPAFSGIVLPLLRAESSRLVRDALDASLERDGHFMAAIASAKDEQIGRLVAMRDVAFEISEKTSGKEKD